MKFFKNPLYFFFIFINSCVFAQFNYQRDWSTYYFGINSSATQSVIDDQDNIIVVGTTGMVSSIPTNPPYYAQFTTLGAHMPNYFITNGNYSDCFISKFRPDGTLVFATYFGGEAPDNPVDVAVDSQGFIYIYGSTSSVIQIATPGAYIAQFGVVFGSNTSAILNKIGFLTKLSPTGQLIWSTYVPCDNYINSQGGMCINKNTDSIYIFGKTVQANANLVSAGAYNSTFQTFPQINTPLNTNGIIFKFDTNGNKIAATYCGAAMSPKSVTTDDVGNVIISGTVSNETAENLSTSGSYQTTRNGTTNEGFIAKFSADLSTKIWFTYFPTVIFKLKTYNNDIYFIDYRDLFKFSDSGNLIWTNNVWSPDYYSLLRDISVKNSFVYIVAITSLITGLTTAGAFQEIIDSSNSLRDGYFAQYNTNGSGKNWGSYFGGSYDDIITNVRVANDNSFYLVGTSSSPTNIATAGSLQPNLNLVGSFTFNNNLFNMFLAKFSPMPLKTKNFQTNNYQINPNPNNGSFSLNGNFQDLNNATLIIYDNLGREIIARKITSTITTFNLENELKTGVYFAKLFNENELLQTFKVLVE